MSVAARTPERERLQVKQTRRSSRNNTPTQGVAENRSRDVALVSGKLSPAKKLAKMMRERTAKKTSDTLEASICRMAEKTETERMNNGRRKSKTMDSNLKNVSVPQVKSPKSKVQEKDIKPAASSKKHENRESSSETSSKKQLKLEPNSIKQLTKESEVAQIEYDSRNMDIIRRNKQVKGESGDRKRSKKEPSKKSHVSCSDESQRHKEKAGHPNSPRKRKSKPEHVKPAVSAAAADGDIAALLRLGEGAPDEVAQMSDDSDWEQVEAHGSELATKGFVEITLPSDVAAEKKKKKGFDMEAYLKRQISKARREMQVLVHKAHVLCLLSRTLQVNALLNSETMLACAMSMLPSKYAYPPKRMSLSYVEKFVKWFREKVSLETPPEGRAPSENVFNTLEVRLRTKKAYSSLELVCLFVLILRAIGVDCRLVMSLQPTPLKPPSAAAAQQASAKQKKTVAKTKPRSASKKPNNTDTKRDKPSQPAVGGRKSRGSAAPARAGADRAARRRSYAAEPDSDADSSGEEFQRRRPDRRVLSSPSGSEEAAERGRTAQRAGVDHWAEVYVEEELRWICVDVVGGGVHCVSQIRKRASAPLTYVLGCDNSGHLKDLTARYDPRWHSGTRKLRVSPDWWDEATAGWRAGPSRRERDEDEEMERELQDRPMPQSIAEFKDHPLYALERHLLKFEAIYPPSAVPLGFVGKGEKRAPVYARECVRMLHSRETWIKKARVVREEEKPYKIVKARPKWDRLLQKAITDKPLEIFGEWQTEQYVPPTAQNGVVPRNDYGNVELFQPSMLPGGCVHLPVEGLSRVAKKLGIDCAPAMVGWDYHCGGSHPVFDGYVVCEEYEDTLMMAWEADQQEAKRRQREKREKRVLENWRRLVRGLRIRQRLANKYSFEEETAANKRPGAAADRPAGGKKARHTDGPALQPKVEPKLEPKTEPDEEEKLGQKRQAKPVPKSAGRPAARLSAKLKARQAAVKPEIKEEPEEEDEEREETREERARRVEQSLAGMALGRLALSSDSEAEDGDGAGSRGAAGAGSRGAAGAGSRGAAGAGSGGVTGAGTERQAAGGSRAVLSSDSSPSAGAAVCRAGPSKRGRRSAAGGRAVPAGKRRRRQRAASASPEPAAAERAPARRRSRRPVNYSEKAGSDDSDAPLREDDLTSDEEQPFARGAPAEESSDDDFEEVGG